MRSGAALSDVGAGQWVQVSLIEAMIFLLDFQAARWTMAQDLLAQVGNNHPTSAPMGITALYSRKFWQGND